MKKRIIFITLTILWMSVIFWFSSKTASNSTEQSLSLTSWLIGLFVKNASPVFIDCVENIVRKLAHFGEYFVLGGFVLATVNSFTQKNVLLKTVLICFIYSVSDEIHQFFVPGRACRVFDIFIDTMGSVFFCFVYSMFLNIKKRIGDKNDR